MVNSSGSDFYSKTRSGKSYSIHFTEKENEVIYILVNLKNRKQHNEEPNEKRNETRIQKHKYNTRSSKSQ